MLTVLFEWIELASLCARCTSYRSEHAMRFYSYKGCAKHYKTLKNDLIHLFNQNLNIFIYLICIN